MRLVYFPKVFECSTTYLKLSSGIYSEFLDLLWWEYFSFGLPSPSYCLSGISISIYQSGGRTPTFDHENAISALQEKKNSLTFPTALAGMNHTASHPAFLLLIFLFYLSPHDYIQIYQTDISPTHTHTHSILTHTLILILSLSLLATWESEYAVQPIQT